MWISLKPIKINIFGSIFATNRGTNKRPTQMIYLRALGAEWNEYGNTTIQKTRNVICATSDSFWLITSISLDYVNMK